MAGFTTIDDRGRVSLAAGRDETTGCAVEYFYSIRTHRHEAALRWPDGAVETVNRDDYATLRDAVNDILVAKAGYGPWVLAVVIDARTLHQQRVYLRRSAHGDWDSLKWVEGGTPPSRDHYVGERRCYYTDFDRDDLPARCKAYGDDAFALPWDPLLGATLADYAASREAARQRMANLLDFAVDRGHIAIKGDLPGVVQQGVIGQIAAETAILNAGSAGSRAYDLTVALSDLLVAMHDRGRWGDGIPDEWIPLVGDVGERAGLPIGWWDDAETKSRRFVLDGLWKHRQYDRWRRGKFAHLAPVLSEGVTTIDGATWAKLPTIADFIDTSPTYGDVQSPPAHTLRPKTEREGK